jgi:signal transduction histidine kinase
MAAEPAPAPLTRIADILSLPRDPSSPALPVRVRGVVTWHGGGAQFILQNGLDGIYINGKESIARHLINQSGETLMRSLREGSEVEVEGHNNPGGYSQCIFPSSVRLLGTQPLPEATPMDRTRFFQGADNSRRIEVRAVVQGFQLAGEKRTLLLNCNPGSFIAVIHRQVCADPASLVDAEIRLCGIVGASFNNRGEFIAPSLITNLPEDLVIEKPAPPPEELPRISLGELQPFRLHPPLPHRVRIEGTVIFSQPESFFYIQDGANAVRVETTSPSPLKPGDRIEATGFVDMTREIGMIRDATVRQIGSVKLIAAATDISPEDILNLNQHANDNGMMAQPHDFDGHLIRFRARLLAVQSNTSKPQPLRRLLLERTGTRADGSSGLVLQANLQSGSTREIDALQPGSELEVTGLAYLTYGPHKENRSLRLPSQVDLILRDARDVVVIQAPSWWTARRLAGLLAVVALVMAAAIFWSLQLKRQVRRKTRLLAKEMGARRDAAVEFQATLRERNLLAANLHDTLLQTMGGLGFQLDVCKAEAAALSVRDRTPAHLAFARRMLDHALEELRNAVWTLRSLPLNGMSIPDALTSITRRIGAGRETRIEIIADPDFPRVPDFIAGNLLLVAQEALHNAVKHASPRTVTIEIHTLDHPPRASLTVHDDGSGFSPGTQLNATDGHFGLLGMHERIDRLAGNFRIQSAPGQGTTIHAEVPLHAYDAELADRRIDSPPPEA